MAKPRSTVVSGWDEPWDDAADLEPLDPGTGRSLPDRSAAPATARKRSVPWQWLFSIALVAASVMSAYAVVNHRAATTLERAWTHAATERAQLSVTTESLRRMTTFLDVSDVDAMEVRRVRSDAVKEAREVLTANRREIAGTLTVDPRSRALRTRMLGHLDRWIAELDDFLAHGRLWVRTAPTQQLDQPVAALAKRWRVERHVAVASSFAPATATIDRLSRPTDVPVPLRFTGFTARGDRLDVDLRAGQVTTTPLGSAGTGFAAPATAQVVDGRLVVYSRDGSGRISFLSLEQYEKVTEADVSGYLPPTPSPAPWVASFVDGASIVQPLSGDHPPITLGQGYALQGSTMSSLVLAQMSGHDDTSPIPARIELLDIVTGARTPLPDEGYLLGAWADTTVWGGRAGRLVVRDGGGGVRVVGLPENLVASHVARQGDGTFVVVADPIGPGVSNWSPQSQLLVVPPGDDEARPLVEATGLVWSVGVSDGWALYVSGASYTRSQVRVVELATGRELIVRLEDPFLTALAVH